MKNRAFLICTIVLTLISGCANEELDAAKRGLEISSADHDHYKVIEYATEILKHDPEDIKAISELRNSTRVFEKLEELAATLAELVVLSEPDSQFDDAFLEGENRTEERAKVVIAAICEPFYFDEMKDLVSFESCSSSSYLKAAKNLILGLDEEEISDEEIYIQSAEKMASVASIVSFAPEIVKLKKNAQVLEDSVALLDEIKSLDPRFLGMTEIEKFIDQEALEAIQVSNMFVLANDSAVSLAVRVQNTLSSTTSSKFDEYSSFGLGISEAFSFAKLDTIWNDITQPVVISAWSDMGQDVLSAYKDLSKAFDFDQLEEGVTLMETSLELFDLATNPSGSLRDWNSATSNAVGTYNDAAAAWINELEDIRLPKTKIQDAEAIAPPKYREAINSALALTTV